MGTEIWNLFRYLIELFSGLWDWLTSPLPLENIPILGKVLRDLLIDLLNIPEITPLGILSVGFIGVLVIYKLIRLFI